MKNLLSSILWVILGVLPASAQSLNPTSSEILLNLKKLNVLGSAMHIGAHPDDENSLLLAYLAKERLINTYYLSLTRGDGGQNLIGTEQGEYIGVIRTQELLGARQIDGAQQLFSRAYDFGFSKTREETLGFWGERKILADVVYLIRKHRPDVLITRFPPDERAGHGHHNSSAYLALEAFKISGDPSQFPEQMAYVKPWKPQRIVWNTYSPGFQNTKPVDAESYVTVDLSGYNPLLGLSYSELAAQSRSMHKTQGFGSAPNRTLRTDYLLHKDGIPATQDLFDGVDLTWDRIPGGKKAGRMIQTVINAFDPSQPSKSVEGLVEIYKELSLLDSTNYYVKIKKEDVQTLIRQCLGLWYETNPNEFSSTPGGKVRMQVNIVNRSPVPVILQRIRMEGTSYDSTFQKPLTTHQALSFPLTLSLPNNLPITQPYWLRQPIKDKIFQFDEQELVGLPLNESALQTHYDVMIHGIPFTYTSPWVYKSVDPSQGEIYRPFEVRPPVTINLSEKVFIFPDQKAKRVQVLLKAHEPNLSGKIRLEVPTGWKVEPSVIAFSTKEKYAEQSFSVLLTPPAQPSEGNLRALVETNRGNSAYSLRSVEYRHIPTQTLFPPAETELVRANIKSRANHIGYIAGAGDDVPAALRQIGSQVTMLEEKELSGNLSGYDAIVVGVRAYNTEDRLVFYQNKLMEYVKNGGTLVVQYVTARNGFLNNGLKVENMGPYPFSISRDRITDETAPMKILVPGHPVFTSPNSITPRDFEGWIQERGLYFATDFETHYTPLIAAHDPGEADLNGGLIYSKYGKGHYIYTGLSFFRELPAGIPGAYKLFANLISLGR
jgi:LmbE family N-acetylglucosaminyl deacetylase